MRSRTVSSVSARSFVAAAIVIIVAAPAAPAAPWKRIPGLEGGHVLAVAADPVEPGTVWAATSGPAIDPVVLWVRRRAAGRFARVMEVDVFDDGVALDATTSGPLLLAGRVLARSHGGLPVRIAEGVIAMDADASGRHIGLVSADGFVRFSHDGGRTWLTGPSVADPESDLDEARVAVGAGGRAIYVEARFEHVGSADGGATWRNLDPDLTFAPLPREPLGAVASGLNAIWRTADAGTTVVRVAEHEAAGPVSVGSGGTLWLTAAGGVERSGDGGVTWARVGNGSDVAADPLDPLRALSADLTGVMEVRVGRPMRLLTAGLQVSPVEAVGVDQAAHLLYASWAGALWQTADHGRHWTRLEVDTAGDITVITGSRHSVVYAGSSRSSDEGLTWISASSVTPDGLDPQLVRRQGTDRAIEQSSDGLRWRRTGRAPTGFSMIAAGGHGTVIARSFLGRIATSGDGGRRWRKRGRLVRPGRIISASPWARSVLFAHDADSGKVEVTRDEGATWSPVRLPATSAFDLVADPARTGVLFAGTAAGVWRSGDGGRTWRADGLRSSIGDVLVVGRRVYAATDAGLFTRALPSPGG
jgi:photosystem II stability/assembly factor-like uncharacterized protein